MRDFFEIPVLETILDEAADVEAYLQGFEGLTFYKNNNNLQSKVRSTIEWAIRVLKKNSRIVWFMRWVKMYLLQQYANRDQHLKGNAGADDFKKYLRELDKFVKQGMDKGMVLASLTPPDRLMTELEHFYTDTLQRNIPKLSEYEPGFSTPNKVLRDLENIEKEASKERSVVTTYEPHRYVTENEVKSKEGWRRVLIVEDGWDWWEIPSHSSRILSRIMSGAEGGGHCGTCQNSRSTILVLAELAEFEGEAAIIAHLSFELGPNGNLLQMKGYKNSKPEKRYHPAIVKLLIEYDDIKGVKGGTYKPETDFKLEDLSREQLEAVEDAKPGIGEVEPDLYTEWNKNGPSDEWMRLVNRHVDSSVSFFSIPEEERDAEKRDPHKTDVEYDLGVRSVSTFVSDYLNQEEKSWSKGHSNDVSRFMAVEDMYPGSNDLSDYLSDDSALEDNPYGSEYEDYVTPALMEKVLTVLLRDDRVEKRIVSYLNRKGDRLPASSKDITDYVVRGKGNGASFVRDLLKRSVMFGLFFANPYSEDIVPFMAYVMWGFGVGPFYTVVDTKGVKDFSDFMSADISFVSSASSFMDWLESYIPDDWDGESDIFGYEGMGSMLTDSDWSYEITRDRSFEYFLENEWDGDEEKFLKEHLPEFKHKDIQEPERTDKNQQALPGMELPREYDFDLEAATEYFMSKIRGGILERKNLAKLVLSMVEKCR